MKLRKIAKAEEHHGEEDHHCKKEKYHLQDNEAEEAKASPALPSKKTTGSGKKSEQVDPASPKTKSKPKDSKAPLNSTKKSEKKKATSSTASPLKGSKNTSTTKKTTESSTGGSKYGKSPTVKMDKIKAKK